MREAGMPIRQSAEAVISAYRMLDGVSSVLAALSGGSDSTALLSLMRGICREKGIRLYAAHVNHMIRGDEAYRDQVFCERLCRSMGVPLFVGIFDVPAAARDRKISVETAARQIRYGYFESLLDIWGIDVCATAHNARDRAETVIFNLSRGASLTGASGIPPVRGRYIRPLIGCGKDEILEYLSSSGLGWVEDSTNSDTVYTRNFIRSEIIPRLERIDTGAVRAISRFADAAVRDGSFIDGIAKGYPSDTEVKTLAVLHDAVLYRWLSLRFKDAGCGETDESHIKAAAALIRGGRKGSMLSLPGFVRMTVTDTVSFGCDPRGKDDTAEYRLRLTYTPCAVPGTDALIAVRSPDDPPLPDKFVFEKNIYTLSILTSLDFDKIKGELFAERRHEGDTVRYLGVSRSLSKLMNELGMPAAMRGITPVIRDDLGIVCVPELKAKNGSVCRDGVYTDKNGAGVGAAGIYERID